jgi:hypothetical protein
MVRIHGDVFIDADKDGYIICQVRADRETGMLTRTELFRKNSMNACVEALPEAIMRAIISRDREPDKAISISQLVDEVMETMEQISRQPIKGFTDVDFPK